MRFVIVSTYDDDGHDLQIAEGVCAGRELAEKVAEHVRDFRADQTQGPVVTIIPLVGRIIDAHQTVYTIHICPDCGEHIVDSDYDPKIGQVWGHYHDAPEGWEGPEDPWIEAVAIKVVSRDRLS